MTSRSVWVLVGLALLSALGPLAACTSSSIKVRCNVDSDCNPGRACVNMRCQDRPDGASGSDASPDAPGRQAWIFSASSSSDLDILFMIDNSQSMQPLISKLTLNFPAFTAVLKGLPNGLPNVHIGVISSNMGAGTETAVGHCPLGGDGGQFQDQIGIGTMKPGGMACAASTGTGLNPNQHFISSVGGINNFTGVELEHVFGCIASLGDEGCGFEHQLAAVQRALSRDDITSADGAPAPVNNAGFLRRNAYLAIILITNEDDCSAPPDSPIFSVNSQFVSDVLGPLWSYRCNEFGHLCNGQTPSRTGAYSFGPGECVPAEEAGQLIPVHQIVANIKSLKDDPSKIFVAAIAGPPDPYSMTPIPAQNNDPQMWPNIDHTCVTGTAPPEFGDPGIRLAAFVKAFDANGLFQSVCANSYAPALQTIAEQIGNRMASQCLDGAAIDKSTCAVTETQFDANGSASQTTLPACDAVGASSSACWQFVTDAPSCPGSLMVAITRPGPPPPVGTIKVSCSPCASPSDPSCFVSP